MLGDLHRLGSHPSPFQAFTALSKIYGDIFSLKLGASSCVVVNTFPLIKEVLITRGTHFGGRPDFLRFHALFGGDRNNSLALCDWSSLQKTRRSIARLYCSPRFASSNYGNLNKVGVTEMDFLMIQLESQIGTDGDVNIKPLLLAACGNMFSQYMCSTRFNYTDPSFQILVRRFDQIFWEINQGYVVDFLPWLQPLYKKHLNKLSSWAHEIRQFILERIIEEHRLTLDPDSPPRDFTDALLMHLEQDSTMNWEHIMFELEDFLGGHSAIGNLAMLVLAAVVHHPEVGIKIQEEVDKVTRSERDINLFDKPDMPYTEAVILETLRTTSSPIVPHVATQTTKIADYTIDKGTVVFLNNYELNTGENYWNEPDLFKPERFLSNGRVIKPEHFIPFSTGKRTCIGQRLVKGFCFIMVGRLLQKYNVSAKDISEIKTYPACVALPPDTYNLRFTPRNI
ncbi:cytochrome P450 307a1-like [Lycorma delicatula]|uniref:cytochrome P450 307a1-like n=1 Tax=Lycorma delicatula TaxID=130591 RepID=UPI003F50ECAF